MVTPKYTPIQLQALMAMAAAGWESVNVASQIGMNEAAAEVVAAEAARAKAAEADQPSIAKLENGADPGAVLETESAQMADDLEAKAAAAVEGDSV